MPASTEPQPRVERAGEVLRFAGALSSAYIPDLWRQLPALAGVQSLDLHAVTAIDSTGLALVAEVATKTPNDVRIEGSPAGLEALRSAYRLDATLGFGRE